MELNIKKVISLIQKQLDKDWGRLEFEYSTTETEASAATGIALSNHSDDIRAIITVFPGGGAVFRAVFDKLDRSPEVMGLLNDFNYSNLFFNAFIRPDGYLELRHFFVCYEENMFKSYSGEFMTRLSQLANNEILKKLTEHTHE